jgi:Fe-S-cluster containining protein
MSNKNLTKKLEAIINNLKSQNIDLFSEKFSDWLNEVEKDFSSFLKDEDKKLIDCKAGCGTCCRVNVSLLLPEIFNIIEFLKANRNKDEILHLKEHIDKVYPNIKGYDDEERMIAGVKCPFLSKDNNCSIYPVRPLLCRSITSTSAERCEQSIIDIVFGTETPIIMNLKQQEYYDELYLYLAKFLYENNLDDRGIRLIESLYFILNDKYNYEDFISGKEIPV